MAQKLLFWVCFDFWNSFEGTHTARGSRANVAESVGFRTPAELCDHRPGAGHSHLHHRSPVPLSRHSLPSCPCTCQLPAASTDLCGVHVACRQDPPLGTFPRPSGSSGSQGPAHSG